MLKAFLAVSEMFPFFECEPRAALVGYLLQARERDVLLRAALVAVFVVHRREDSTVKVGLVRHLGV